MFGKSIKLFNLFGFEVKIDVSWFFLVLLVTWSLAVGLFPYYYKGLPTVTYWWMGISGALGLFLSIIAHEFMHSLIARNSGLPMKGITLFLFGGVAHMEAEPSSAKIEFYMAIAGPVTSIVLGFVFFTIGTLGKTYMWPLPITGVIKYLAFINWLLAGFNLIPGFPLDGGRVLRAVLWAWKKNLRWATRIASRIGSGISFLLIFIGIIQFFSGNFIGGVWIFMIGMFLYNASRMSYRQLIMRQALEGEKVSRFMKPDPVTVPLSVSIDELVENYVYKYHFKMFPVVDEDDLVGCITTREVKKTPRSEWKRKKVQDVVQECSNRNTITSDTDAVKALARMNRVGTSRLLVVDGPKLMGIITLKDVMRFLSVKLDLNGYENGDELNHTNTAQKT